jgi:mannose/cellobiose epimerase-like protein (N-acyl-D-glucosamine 2-epimerase family)
MTTTPPFATQAEARAALRTRAEAGRAWLWDAALPLWWTRGYDRAAKCFHEKLSMNAEPEPGPRRVRVQARQTAVYAIAGRAGWDGPWREAVEAGVTVLLGQARHPEGGVRHLLSDKGAPLDSRRDLYDLAFAIFGLAHAGRALGRPALIGAAEAHLDWLEQAWTRPEGGFAEGDVAPTPPRRQNPHMHLFEAVLALCEVTRSAEHLARAERLFALFTTRLYDAGCGALPEFFTDDWRPAPGDAGRRAEAGHHFEWSWLLQRYSALTQTPLHSAAIRLCAHAEKHGVDTQRGVAIDEMWIDGTMKLESARLWPQTERLKANAGLFTLTSDLRAAAAAAEAFDTLMRYFETPIRGLWRDRMQPDGRFIDQAAPASSFYHIMVALDDLSASFGA